MSGPVWRFEKDRSGTCAWCLAEVTGVFVEGEVRAGELQPERLLCPECYRTWREFFLFGEVGSRPPGPAYAHR